MFDRETLFKMLFDKKWDEIAKILYRNPASILTDPVIKQAIQLFENEFFADIETLSSKEKLQVFEYPGLVIELSEKSFSSSFVARFIDEKLKILRELESDTLISFAASHQERPLAKEILKEIESTKPESIADAYRENVSIKSTKTDSRDSKIIKLFKSKQEEFFFRSCS